MTLFFYMRILPAHTNFTISIEDSKSTEAQKKKCLSVELTKINYNPTYRKDSVFNTKVKILGKYAWFQIRLPQPLVQYFLLMVNGLIKNNSVIHSWYFVRNKIIYWLFKRQVDIIRIW
jgi:hypothetical protein